MENLSIDKLKEPAKKASMEILAISGGMIGANVIVKGLKKDNLAGNSVLLVGGAIGAAIVKNPTLRLLIIGGAVFGGMRCLNIAAKKVTGSTEGLAGLIPDSIKAKIAQFMPQLNGAETLLGEGDDFGDVNLDDVGEVGYSQYEEVGSSVNGLGSSSLLL